MERNSDAIIRGIEEEEIGEQSMAAEVMPESDNIKSETLSLMVRARAIKIIDQESLALAHAGLIQIKTIRKRIDQEFDAGIKQAFDHHRHLVAQKRKWTDALDGAEKDLKPKIIEYLAEQDRIRLKAEREAALAKAAAAKEAEAAIDKAHEMIDEGAVDEASVMMDRVAEKSEAKIAEAVAAIPDKPAAPGTSLGYRWDYEVENELLIPRAFLMINKERIRSYVNAMKEQGVIPGVRIFKKPNLSVRVPE